MGPAPRVPTVPKTATRPSAEPEAREAPQASAPWSRPHPTPHRRTARWTWRRRIPNPPYRYPTCHGWPPPNRPRPRRPCARSAAPRAASPRPPRPAWGRSPRTSPALGPVGLRRQRHDPGRVGRRLRLGRLRLGRVDHRVEHRPRAGVVEPFRRVLGEQPVDDVRQRARVLRLLQLLGHHRGQRRDRGTLVVRRHALDRRVQQSAERPQVGRGARLVPAGPFRGDVGGRADEHAGRGDRRVALDLGDAEVGEHDPLGVGLHQDVRRLHVTVQDALAVRRTQHVEDGQPDLRGPPRLQQAVLPDELGERLALDEFHHDPRPVVLLDHVEDRHRAVVADPRDRLGLAQRPRDQPALLVLVDVRREPQLLDGDRPAQRFVLGPPHRAHATTAEHLPQPVPPGEKTLAVVPTSVLTRCSRPLRLRHASPHATRPDRAFIVPHPTSARRPGCPWHSTGCLCTRGPAEPRRLRPCMMGRDKA